MDIPSLPDIYPVSKLPDMAIIYGLLDPRTNELRYVGKTSAKLKKRFQQHIYFGKIRTKKTNWLKSLRETKQEPRLIVLQIVKLDEWRIAEQSWIVFFRNLGSRLTNLTDGGDGRNGAIVTQEMRKRMSDAHKGKIISLEQREKMRQGLKGRVVSEETRKKISEAHKGRKISQERLWKLQKGLQAWRIKTSEKPRGMLGKKHTDEARQKISLAGRGRPRHPNAGRKSRFTSEILDEMKKMIDAGTSRKEIGLRFNCTRQVLKIVLREKLGISPKPIGSTSRYSGQQKSEMKRLDELNVPRRQIAKMFECSPGRITHILNYEMAGEPKRKREKE